MIKIILSQIIFIPILLFLLPSLLIRSRQFAQNDPEPQQIESFTNQRSYQLKLTPPPNCSLSSISFRLKNPLILNHSQIVADIIGNDQLLQSLSFFGANVGDPSWVPLKTISSPALNYVINLSTNNSDPNSLYLYTNSFSSPVFKASCRLNFIDNLNYVYHHRLAWLREVNLLDLLTYLGLIIFLNYVLSHPHSLLS